ncbi:hypothetical protein UA75_29550 [Actinoalloteichus sp. GBA129-24]|nr:hypothetical protein UA75_29550 [Actinoalloteichus sp. GBA129-24]
MSDEGLSKQRTGRLWTTWLTSTEHGVDHAVTDESAQAGRASGEYVAVCGATVLSAPLTCEPLPPCRQCAATVRAGHPSRQAAERAPRGPVRRGSWLLSRLLRCVGVPGGAERG